MCGCEPPNEDAGNLTQVLWKTGSHCLLSSHLFSLWLLHLTEGPEIMA